MQPPVFTPRDLQQPFATCLQAITKEVSEVCSRLHAIAWSLCRSLEVSQGCRVEACATMSNFSTNRRQQRATKGNLGRLEGRSPDFWTCSKPSNLQRPVETCEVSHGCRRFVSKWCVPGLCVAGGLQRSTVIARKNRHMCNRHYWLK